MDRLIRFRGRVPPQTVPIANTRFFTDENLREVTSNAAMARGLVSEVWKQLNLDKPKSKLDITIAGSVAKMMDQLEAHDRKRVDL